MGRRVSTKVSCTVLSGGKSRDNIKGLPIAIHLLYDIADHPTTVSRDFGGSRRDGREAQKPLYILLR